MSYLDQLTQEIDFDFQERKLSTYKLIESYNRLGFSEKANKVKMCGTDLVFRVPADFSDTAKLYQANFCKDRLCWMCSWRRTKKIYGQVSKVMNKLEADSQYRFVFVTLTVRNCSGPELKSTLDLLANGFHLFNKRSRIKKAFEGAFRTFEVTYHPENPDCFQFHPHIHIIYACRPSYFTSSVYIKQKELIQIWRECVGSTYDPVVDIRIVRPTDDGEGEISFKQAVAEVAKYTVKPEQIFVNRTDEEIDCAVWHMTGAMSGRRMCSFTGCFKKVAAALKLDDLDDGDLVNTDNETIRRDVTHMLIYYKWRSGFGYELVQVRYEEKENVE